MPTPDLAIIAASFKTVGGLGATCVNGFSAQAVEVGSITGPDFACGGGNSLLVAIGLGTYDGIAPQVTDSLHNSYDLIATQTILFSTVFLYLASNISFGTNAITAIVSGLSDWDMAVGQYAGLIPSAQAYDASAVGGAIAGTSVALPALNVSASGDLIICACYGNAGDTFALAPGSWNFREQSDNQNLGQNSSCIALFDILSQPIGSYIFTVSLSYPLEVFPGIVPIGYIQESYTFTFSAVGGVPPYTFSLYSGSLPPGLALFPSGVVIGTPTVLGTFLFTVKVTDSSGATATLQSSIVITTHPIPPVVITVSGNPPGGAVGTPYSYTFTASGGTAPYTFALNSGSLPTGLTLSSGGILSGIPTASGPFTFQIKATDSASNTGTGNFSISITAPVPLEISGSPVPGTFGVAYSFSYTASGGTAPYSFSVSAGTLPAGLSLSGGGVLSGTPTFAGTFSFTVKVTDSLGATAVDPSTLVISYPAAPQVQCNNPPVGYVGIPYDHDFTATGWPSFTFSITAGSLPPGLSMDSAGEVTGTPTVPGTYNFTVTAMET